MLRFNDLFQWDRFITPTIIKSFYWLVIVLIGLFGVSGIFSALTLMAVSPFGGFVALLASLAGTLVGIIFSRIAAEFILIVFRMNEHLGAILVELVRQRHVPRGKGGERAHQRRGRHALHLGERARPQLASMTHRQWRIREAR